MPVHVESPLAMDMEEQEQAISQPLARLHPELFKLMADTNVYPFRFAHHLSEEDLAELVDRAMGRASIDVIRPLITRIMSDEEAALHRLQSHEVTRASSGVSFSRLERSLLLRWEEAPDERGVPKSSQCLACLGRARVSVPCGCQYCYVCLRNCIRIGLESELSFPPRCCVALDERTVSRAGCPALFHLFRAVRGRVHLEAADERERAKIPQLRDGPFDARRLWRGLYEEAGVVKGVFGVGDEGAHRAEANHPAAQDSRRGRNENQDTGILVHGRSTRWGAQHAPGDSEAGASQPRRTILPPTQSRTGTQEANQHLHNPEHLFNSASRQLQSPNRQSGQTTIARPAEADRRQAVTNSLSGPRPRNVLEPRLAILPPGIFYTYLSADEWIRQRCPSPLRRLHSEARRRRLEGRASHEDEHAERSQAGPSNTATPPRNPNTSAREYM